MQEELKRQEEEALEKARAEKAAEEKRKQEEEEALAKARAEQEERAEKAKEEEKRREEKARVEEARPATPPMQMASTLKSLVPMVSRPVELEAAQPVWKRTWDGCQLWECVLEKRSETDKFGFSHCSGKKEYFKALGVSENATDVAGPEVLFIRKVGGEGLLFSWNEAHPDAVVQPGDRISKVNGQTSVDSMAQELRSSKVCIEVMRYPEEFEVSLSKKADTNKKLGFKFEKPSNEKVRDLKITEVSAEGHMPDRNEQMVAKQRFHYVVTLGMRIIRVNSVEGDAHLMKDELKNAHDLTIRVRRAEVYALQKARMVKQAQILASLSNLSATMRMGSSNQLLGV